MTAPQSLPQSNVAAQAFGPTFDDKNHDLMGGTGKHKGITGTVPYAVGELHEAVGGRTAYIVNHKATWEIK